MNATSAVRIHPASSQPLSVVCADDSHATALAAFYRSEWNPAATSSGVARARRQAALLNDVQPGVAPPTFVGLHHGRILALAETIPARLWDGRKTWPAYWIKGPLVRPDARYGPAGLVVLRTAVAHVGRAVALAAEPAARRLFTEAGCRDLGVVQNWILPLAPRQVLARLDLEALGLSGATNWLTRDVAVARRHGIATVSGWAASDVVRGVSARLRMQGRNLAAGHEIATTSELDDLWHATRASLPAGIARDSHYLLRRYDPTGFERYLWIAAREHGTLRGVAILREPRPADDARLNGINMAVLSDLMYASDRTDVGLALLGEVERVARQLDADAVLASGSAHSMRSVLLGQRYVQVAPTVHLFHRDVPGAGASFAPAVDDWWLTRGDALADEVF